jgi:hypothetical protein
MSSVFVLRAAWCKQRGRGKWKAGGDGGGYEQVCQPPPTDSWTRGVGTYQSRLCDEDVNGRATAAAAGTREGVCRARRDIGRRNDIGDVCWWVGGKDSLLRSLGASLLPNSCATYWRLCCRASVGLDAMQRSFVFNPPGLCDETPCYARTLVQCSMTMYDL